VKAPISACLIVKNEIGQIENCLKSIRPYVEEIVVVDTGSTDGTPEVVKKYADIFEVFTGCNDSEGRIESFSVARQRSFDLATQPWLFWIDGDDEVQGAERLIELTEKYDKLRNGSPMMVVLPYDYSFDDKGNVTCLHYRERLITPKTSCHWVSPIHEICTPNGPGSLMAQDEAVRIVHKRHLVNKQFEPNRNLRILKSHYEKHGESDVRHLYYLGLEYGNVGDLGNAIKFHKRYVELSGWDDERFLACLKVAEHYQAMGDYDSSVEWASKALIVREGWCEAYFSLGKSFYYMAQKGGKDAYRNWERSVHFFSLGLSLPPTKTILFVNPMERDYDVHRYYNLALHSTGQTEKALESVEKALQIRPDDSGLVGNKKIYENDLARKTIDKNLMVLSNIGTLSSDQGQLILDVLSGKLTKSVVEAQPEITNSPNITSDLKLSINTKHEIVFYVGPGPEPWTPLTAKKAGIGGSETAVIEMGKRLAKLGHTVRVYGDCPNNEGIYDGVSYLNHTKFQNQSCDVLITSRRPEIVDDVHNVKRKISLCWVHDVHCGSALSHDRALRVDKFLVLSQWHKQNMLSMYKFIHPDQVLVTRNGIDLERFNKKVTRDPHRAVYSSSPDRGMQVAIQIWPRVRERVPGAELHVYYGFQTWEASAGPDQLNLINMLKKLLHDYETAGVVFHGRVSQDILAEEYLKSGVWAYPTWFSETSCISAMEAHAAGLRMVTSPIAALNETVSDRGSMISGDWLSLDYQNRFIDSVVAAMTKTDESDRLSLQQYAHDNFSWDSLALEWSKMFDDLIVETAEKVIPPYKGWI
jgi:glycosyltransferase involved in cell wall biosynthesis